MAMDLGEGAKKRMLDEICFNSATSAIPDDKKHKVEEDSQFSDDKVEKACQFATPEMPPCLPSVETDAAGAGTDEPAPDIIVTHEGAGGLGLSSAETGAPGAGTEELLADVVVPRESFEVELNGLPIVETDATGAAAGAGTADPAPDIVVPHEGGGGLGLPSVETVAPGAGSDEHAPDIVVPREGGRGSGELPSIEPDSPEDADYDSTGYEPEGFGSQGEEDDADSGWESPTPTRDLKSAKVANIRVSVFKQLMIQWDSRQEHLLEAIVTPSDQPACFVVSSILYAKLGEHSRWRIAQSHQHEGSSYVYVKVSKSAMLRFHAKMYGWGEARVAFCSVSRVVHLKPDPMDAHQVVLVS